jgi:hypothetical protein
MTKNNMDQIERIKQIYLAPGPRRTLDADDLDWISAIWQQKLSPDMNWVTKRIACGGIVDTDEEMAMLAEQGVTHILNMSEWDDTSLAQKHGIESLWNYTDDDFEPKSPEFFDRGVRFAKRVLANKNNKLFVHCAMGINRGPMMTLAVMCSMGWKLKAAQRLIKKFRTCACFPRVYVNSIRRYYAAESRQRRRSMTQCPARRSAGASAFVSPSLPALSKSH